MSAHDAVEQWCDLGRDDCLAGIGNLRHWLNRIEKSVEARNAPLNICGELQAIGTNLEACLVRLAAMRQVRKEFESDVEAVGR